MTVTLNAKGTSSTSFKIGKHGTTLYQGTAIDAATAVSGDFYFDTDTGSLLYKGATPAWQNLVFDDITFLNNSIITTTGNSAILLGSDITITPELAGDVIVGTPGPGTIEANTGETLSLIAPSGLILNGITYPAADGTTGQVLTTNGSGVLSFTTVSGSGSTALSALTDVTLTSPSSGEVLAYNGTVWVNSALPVSSLTTSGIVELATTTETTTGTDATRATTPAGVAAVKATLQPLDATLTALAGVTTAANTLIYATGADVFTTAPITAYGRSLIDDADAATARTTLGLGTAATTTVQTNVSDTTAGRVLIVGATAATLGADVATSAQLVTKASLNTAPQFKNTVCTFVNKGNVTGTASIDPLEGADQLATMTANTTFSFVTTGLANNESAVVNIEVVGAFTPTWPAGIYWSGAAIPPYASRSTYTFNIRKNGAVVEISGYQSSYAAAAV